ncbi:MAG TPA: Fic family protein [Acidimicrobiales bacterium]|nr:Fic family protein [Acidimicrobiales bacterium]
MTRYLSLGEYVWLAEQVTGTEATVLAKAAVLTCRLAWNHPLPDGNKRAAWASLVMFLDLNDCSWDPDPPNVDEAEAAMLAVAAHEVDEGWFAAWLRYRVRID